MMTYKELLNKLEIISEEEFNSLVNSLPDNYDSSDLEIDLYDVQSIDGLAIKIIDEILKNWTMCWCDDANVEKRTTEIYDVQSIYDLEEIAETLKGWTISNYDELVDEIKSNEEESAYQEHQKKMNMFQSVVDYISLEDLSKFINDKRKSIE